jgi:DNA ligase-1
MVCDSTGGEAVIDETQMTLCTDMRGDRSVVGWLASEKIFDCRVMWDGETFWTRHGNAVKAPKWFTRGLPRCRIDGGIYAGRTGFEVASAATRFGGEWFGNGVEFVAFDFPDMAATWDKRITEAAHAVNGCRTARATAFERIDDIHHFIKFLTGIRKLGGEGGIFRNPDAVGYETGRSENYQRVKYEEKK